MKNKKIVFYGIMSMILISAGAANAAPGGSNQLTSKGYVDAQVTNVNTNMGTALAGKADKATTLSGYGITDAMTTTEITSALGTKADTASLGALATKNTVTTTDIDDASVTKPKLDLNVQATLDKADTALQSADLTSYAQTADVNTALATKADQATTYTKTEVDTSLSTKADTTYVDTGLSTKADQATTYNKTEVDTALGAKADTTDVNTALADKANTVDVNTALGTKEDVANKSTDMTIDTGSTTKYTTVNAVETYVGGVLTGVNTNLSGKEDVANKSDNIKTDTGSTTKYTTVNAVETYSVPKPAANCLGAQAQCVLSINKTSGEVYWEDVAVSE